MSFEINDKKNLDLEIVSTCKLTNFWDKELNKTRGVTLIFWSDGSVTWEKD